MIQVQRFAAEWVGDLPAGRVICRYFFVALLRKPPLAR
jgi:hypothetical protein